MPVVFGWLGLFLGLSVSSSTGASRLFSRAHDPYRNDHFIPLLSTYYA